MEKGLLVLIMSKYNKQIISFLLLSIVSIVFLSGCGTSKYVGTWYPIANDIAPSDFCLHLSEDHTFWLSEGNTTGTWSEEDNCIEFTGSGDYGDEILPLTIGEYDGEIALILEDGGMTPMIQDYDRAVELHNSMKE